MPLDGSTYQDEVQLCPDVNGPELMRLAQDMEKCPLGFDMASAFPNYGCGSAGCVIGHARLFWHADQVARGENPLMTTEIGVRLGLTREQNHQLLFCAKHGGPAYGDVTKEMAVATLRHLTRTGEVRFDL